MTPVVLCPGARRGFSNASVSDIDERDPVSTSNSTRRRAEMSWVASAFAVLLAVVLLVVGLGFGFGIGTACTNHFGCTADSCPPACDRVSIGVSLNTVGQLALVAWGCVQALRRRGLRKNAVAAAGASVTLCALSYLLARSWELAA